MFSVSYWEVPSFLSSFCMRPLFSITYWEVPLAPLFSKSHWEAICTLRFRGAEAFARSVGGVAVTFAGVTALRRTSIALLAYSYWLEKSRNKVSFASSEKLSLADNVPSDSPTPQGWSLRQVPVGGSG